MARSGMNNLLTRLRDMVDDVGTAVWTDDQLQDVLDQHKYRLLRERLEAEKTNLNSTTYEYRIFHSHWGNLEEGGTAYFNIEASNGDQRGTDTYTVDYVRGVVTMTTDQAGTALYLTGWSYDLAGAASTLWKQRAGKVSSYYDAQTDGHRLSRSQWFAHCKEMSEMYAREARARTVRMWRNDLVDDL